MFESTIGFLITSLKIGLLILAIILALLFFFQNKILYLPTVQGLAKSPKENPVGYRYPGEMGIKYEDVEIKTADGVMIRGFFLVSFLIKTRWLCLNTDSQNIPTIVYFHENAGNIGTRIFFLKEYMVRLKVNILLMAYRGYSDSDGEPSEIGLQEDAKAVMKYVFARRDLTEDKIYIHGRSLGGAVSVYVTDELNLKLAGLILEITFTSLSDMVDVIFPKLAIFKKLLLQNHWRSIDRIGKITLPMHFIYAMKDELVPPAQMQKLQNAAKNAIFSTKHVVDNGSHNNNWQLDADSYFQSIKEFLEKSQQEGLQIGGKKSFLDTVD